MPLKNFYSIGQTSGIHARARAFCLNGMQVVGLTSVTSAVALGFHRAEDDLTSPSLMTSKTIQDYFESQLDDLESRHAIFLFVVKSQVS